MSLLLLILCGIIGFTLLFVACELSHRMTCAFDTVNVYIEQLNWYLFPIEVKRMLPMIIATAQEKRESCIGMLWKYQLHPRCP